MTVKQKIWDIKSYHKEKASCLAAELGISTIVTSVLLERGYDTAENIRDFLYGSKEPFYDPLLMKDMQRTVERILQAVAAYEKITVYGDYDVDGITASSLLYLYLKSIGANVNTYIPKRDNEGYGLNDEALKYLHQSGTGLVVTVDCGISGYKEVADAPQGMDIIITDHHTVPDMLPPAYAIVNPKQKDCQYPFKSLSGVGIAFKLCQALDKVKNSSQEYWSDLTELAALGTVADIVPLVDENREIVRRGLLAMKNTQLKGLQALIKVSGCCQDNITSENIGFMLAPRLNAVGRLEHAQSAVELLVSDDDAAAMEIAEKLNHENMIRQEISRSIMEDAENMLSREEHIDTAIVLASENWHQGVIGIVASRLVEKYHLPVVLMSIADGIAKGSCRSIPALNLYEAIKAESDILIQFGGHHQAAGLTLKADDVAEFRERFKDYVRQNLSAEDYCPHLSVDCVLSDTGLITVRDLEELSLLEPFGCENPAPVFAFNSALLYNYRLIGKDKNHIQFCVTKGDNSYKAVMWNKADMLTQCYDNMVANVAYMPKINVWNGEKTVQLHVLSVLQNIVTEDYRMRQVDKNSLLDSFMRVSDALTVYVNENSKADLSAMGSRVLVKTYGETCTTQIAFLYDLPLIPLKKIVQKLKQEQVKIIVMAFNFSDREKLEKSLKLIYPDRETMAAGYKKVMELLNQNDTVKIDDILNECSESVSENIIKVMLELGFIVRSHGCISLGVIKKCSLEDSALYNELQDSKEKLIAVLKDNLRLTQHELLKNDKY